MTDNLELALKVKADVDNAIQGVRKLDREIDKQADTSKKSAGETNRLARELDKVSLQAQNAQINFGGYTLSLRGAVIATAALVAVHKVFQGIAIADRFQQIQLRVERATKASGDYAKVWADIVRIANESGSEIGTTVSLFEGVNRAAPEIGATRDQVLAVTQAVSQLGVLSGATGTQMANAMLQFQQAMAGGIVRAEEFNSIVENTPAVAEAIALGMGKTVGELRKAVISGQVLSRDVFASLLSQAPQIAEKMQEAGVSLERASQQWTNNFLRSLSALDELIGASETLANIVDDSGKAYGRIADKLEEINKNSKGERGADNEFNDLLERRLELLKRLQKLSSQPSAGFITEESIRVTKQSIAEITERMKKLAETRDKLLKEGADRAPILSAAAESESGVPQTLATAIGAQSKANDEISRLVTRRQTLLDQLDALSQKLGGPSPVEDLTTNEGILTANRLRGNAQDKFDAGDLTGGLADLERAKSIVEALAESGEVSKGYLQTQVDLIRKLADEAKDVEIVEPVKIDADAAKKQAAEAIKGIQEQFEKDNDIKLEPYVDTANAVDQFRRSIAELRREAAANPVQVEVVISQRGGLGETININVGNKTLVTQANEPVTPEVLEALRNAQVAEGERP